MAEEIIAPVQEAGSEQPTVEPSNLPSDKTEGFKGFSDEFVQSNMHENGLFMGRYKDADAFMEAYKTTQAANARLGNEIKQLKEGTNKEAIEQRQQVETVQQKQTALQEVLPDVLNNNMQFNDELIAKIEAAGLDINEVKVNAYEAREQITKAQNIVGGSEEYTNMINWAKDSLSEAQQKAFNNDVASAMSEFAVRGLHAQYKESLAQQEANPSRIQGDGSGKSITGYTSQADMIRDRDYVNRNPHDKAAAESHKLKLAKTDNIVLGLR